MGRPPLGPGTSRRTSSRSRVLAGSMSTAEPADPEKPSDSTASTSASGSNSGASSGSDAAKALRRAEALCSEQRFEEVVPLLEDALRALRMRGAGESLASGQGWQSTQSMQAELWAHLGVAHQSLGRMHEALASYGRAAALNPSLHACFANLAVLHRYLGNLELARRHIDSALVGSPDDDSYL